MSAIPRKPSVNSGKTVQDFTALVDAVRQGARCLRGGDN